MEAASMNHYMRVVSNLCIGVATAVVIAGAADRVVYAEDCPVSIDCGCVEMTCQISGCEDGFCTDNGVDECSQTCVINGQEHTQYLHCSDFCQPA
jgi:hypothetical protein